MKFSLFKSFILSVSFIFTSLNLAYSLDNHYLILPESISNTYQNLYKNNKEKIDKKINGLLKLQIQLRNSYIKEPVSERLNAMKKMGMKTVETQIDKHTVFIHTQNKLRTDEINSLKNIGITVYEDLWVPPLSNHPTGYVMADVPVDRLYDLAEKDFVVRLETAERILLPKNDKAAENINTVDVWNDYGFCGTGIKIAILDSGLDTSHNDIPSPIASKDYSNYPILDDTIENTVSEHGTHVTGSALGRGTQSNGKYKGMAYDADLIFLKVGDDFSGGIPTNASLAATIAAKDIYDADIVSMSFGGLGTYNDGSDESDQAIDYIFSKGALIFVSAGNESDVLTHYSGTVTANTTTDFIQINVLNTRQALLYFLLNWIDGKNTTNDLDISVFNSNKIELTNTTHFESEESPRGAEADFSLVNFPVSGPSTYYVKVSNNSDNDQFFHLYSSDYDVTFEDADEQYTILSPATADNAIAVGSYVTRTSWVDYRGNYWSYTIDDSIDEISSFSSRGPRIDGTIKPDLSTPGQGIVSAKDKIITSPGPHDSLIIDNDGINDGNGPADYLISQGTSMACPIAAGAAALLLEAYPSYKKDPDTIRNALLQTASNKGNPDTVYGYGKLNISAALNYLSATNPSPSLMPSTTPVSTPTQPEASPTAISTVSETGKLFGLVKDEHNTPIKKAKIKLKGIDTKIKEKCKTSADGYFEFEKLPSDTYKITVKKKKYKRIIQHVNLSAGEMKEIEIVMKKK